MALPVKSGIPLRRAVSHDGCPQVDELPASVHRQIRDGFCIVPILQSQHKSVHSDVLTVSQGCNLRVIPFPSDLHAGH